MTVLSFDGTVYNSDMSQDGKFKIDVGFLLLWSEEKTELGIRH